MNYIPLILVGVLLFSSIPLTESTPSSPTQNISIHLTFSDPILKKENQRTSLQIPEAPQILSHPGSPLLPMYTETLTFPFGTKIESVDYHIHNSKTIKLSAPIKISSNPIVLESSSKQTNEKEKNPGTSVFPQKQVQYYKGGGILENKRQTFLTLQIFPVQYDATTQQLYKINTIDINVKYRHPSTPKIVDTSIYDLVIITPAQFTAALSPLVDHKNMLGIKTTIKPLHQIYTQYLGNDKPEQIKYFIKDAIEQWGIQYVLLVGGMKSAFYGIPRDNLNEGTRDWYLPIRYSNLIDNNTLFDPGFISDLYYADIYDSEGDFSSWDSNGDGIYGSWLTPSFENNHMFEDIQIDHIDFFPDISIGRLPCRNLFELSHMVNKIITYEQQPADSSWFHRLLLIAGDPYDDKDTNYIEGELIAESIVSELPEFMPVRLYASNRYQHPLFTPQTDNIIRELSAGCGFVLFDGHATPGSWNTFWPGDFNRLIKNGGISIYDFHRLTNQEKLPICVIGGCHASQCNVSLFRTIRDRHNNFYMWSYGTPIPECFSWWLTRALNGGAIATIGSTGLGYEDGGEKGDLNGDGINEPDCVESLGGYLEINFFNACHAQHYGHLGQTWSTAITNYLLVFPGMSDRTHAKTIEQWLLIGDPSLKIGGYS